MKRPRDFDAEISSAVQAVSDVQFSFDTASVHVGNALRQYRLARAHAERVIDERQSSAARRDEFRRCKNWLKCVRAQAIAGEELAWAKQRVGELRQCKEVALQGLTKRRAA